MKKYQLLRILTNSFSNEWRRLTKKVDERVNSMVEDSFLIDEILSSINLKISRSDDRVTAIRYQRYILVRLSKNFAMILFIVSDEGKDVTQKTIEDSQKILKNEGKCPIHPCSKIF